MIQHHNCLYCGKPFNTGFKCYCPESQPKYYFTTKAPSNYGMTPLQHQDLMYRANSLPKVEPFNHREMVMVIYISRGWSGVDAYCMEIERIASLESRRETLIQKLGKYLSQARAFLTGLINQPRKHHFRIVDTEFKEGYYAQARLFWILWNPLHISKRKTIDECEAQIKLYVKWNEIKNWTIRYKCNEL